MEGHENIEQEIAELRSDIESRYPDVELEAEIARVKALAETLSAEDGTELGEITELDTLIAISYALENATDGEPDYASALNERVQAKGVVGDIDPMPYMVDESGVVHTADEMRE